MLTALTVEPISILIYLSSPKHWAYLITTLRHLWNTKPTVTNAINTLNLN